MSRGVMGLSFQGPRGKPRSAFPFSGARNLVPLSPSVKEISLFAHRFFRWGFRPVGQKRGGEPWRPGGSPRWRRVCGSSPGSRGLRASGVTLWSAGGAVPRGQGGDSSAERVRIQSNRQQTTGPWVPVPKRTRDRSRAAPGRRFRSWSRPSGRAAGPSWRPATRTRRGGSRSGGWFFGSGRRSGRRW
jgi:hypothetical protein